MTTTPTTPRKRAPGAGRKPKPGIGFLVKIWVPDEEAKDSILNGTTPEERGNVLLFASGYHYKLDD